MTKNNGTSTVVEKGNMGRIAYARVAPGEDLIHGIEKLCLTEGFKNAFVRGALGSLVDAHLEKDSDDYFRVEGPGVEIVSLAGEVRSNDRGVIRGELSGVVSDMEGNIYGGSFIAGLNPVFVTFEVTLEEWLPEHQYEKKSLFEKVAEYE